MSMQPGNLDLLLNVDLEVTAEIGTTPISIAEVLALAPGSVVEFRRTIEQPVDLKVNGRLLARGEIVAVDGRFGLRVTPTVAAVPTPQSHGTHAPPISGTNGVALAQ
jgi:flagellar motor switch protein FliN/FliY